MKRSTLAIIGAGVLLYLGTRPGGFLSGTTVAQPTINPYTGLPVTYGYGYPGSSALPAAIATGGNILASLINAWKGSSGSVSPGSASTPVVDVSQPLTVQDQGAAPMVTIPDFSTGWEDTYQF